ncbi:MAG: bifunctional riboflavin kinase/FAD synthetase [Thermodesulfobacteriota bacterium]
MGTYYSDLNQIRQPFPAAVLTIGNFDGIHLGHQSLFQKVRERSQAIKGTSLVITFHPHPAAVLRPGRPLRQIVSDERKVDLIFRQGIEVVLSIPFTKEFSQVSADDFVQDILVSSIGMKEIVVGYDYTFGKKREGNIHLLQELGDRLGFVVHIHPPVTVGNHLVSSTRVRELITTGAMEEAKLILGRPFSLSGTIIPGKGIGRSLLGFPTANLQPNEQLIPQRGVYVVLVESPQGFFYGVTNVGFNPTFEDGKVTSIETFLFDFNNDLYGKNIKVFFLKRLRGERAFSGPEALKIQINKDIDQAKKWLEKEKLNNFSAYY